MFEKIGTTEEERRNHTAHVQAYAHCRTQLEITLRSLEVAGRLLRDPAVNDEVCREIVSAHIDTALALIPQTLRAASECFEHPRPMSFNRGPAETGVNWGGRNE